MIELPLGLPIRFHQEAPTRKGRLQQHPVAVPGRSRATRRACTHARTRYSKDNQARHLFTESVDPSTWAPACNTRCAPHLRGQGAPQGATGSRVSDLIGLLSKLGSTPRRPCGARRKPGRGKPKWAATRPTPYPLGSPERCKSALYPREGCQTAVLRESRDRC